MARSPADPGRRRAGETIPDPMAIASDATRRGICHRTAILVRRDGFEIPIEDSVAPIHDREGQATRSGHRLPRRERRPARWRIRWPTRPQHDFLTGLPNRMLLNDRVGQAIALAPRHQQARSRCCFSTSTASSTSTIRSAISIGDKLLQSIAKRLVDCVRGSDTVSRQGGDEFVVLLSEVDAAGGLRRSQRGACSQAVAEAHSIDGHDLHVTTSIGVSVYPDDGLDAETLIKNADTAMYQAKENGRQGFRFFKPAMNVRAVERQSIEESLRRALERQRIRAALPAQDRPQDRRDHRRGSAAALDPSDARADPAGAVHPDRRGLRPDPADRRLGAARGVRAGARLDRRRPAAQTIAVNVSAMEFRDENFLENLFAILEQVGPRSAIARTGTDRKRADEARSSRPRRSCKPAGQGACRSRSTTSAPAIRALSYLRKFPLDALKIDQSFVRQISTAGDDTRS